MWYRRANVCIAYLSDIIHFSDQESSLPKGYKKNWHDSRWFSRGWTLQELIAPSKVEFYNATWAYIGSKHSLATEISRTTSIDETILRGEKGLDDFSVAQKMSWAANRQTTVPEDRAYSLLGIFDVSIPPIYDGNGCRAFNTLQKQIVDKTNDHSIFAWTAYGSCPWDIKTSIYKWKCNLFAPSPDFFRLRNKIVPYSPNEYPDEPFEVKNNGLHINIPVRVVASRDEDVLLEGALACKDITKGSGQATILFSTSNKEYDSLFSRQGTRTYSRGELSLQSYSRLSVTRVEPYYLGTINIDQNQDNSLAPWKRFPLQIKDCWASLTMPARPEEMTIELMDQLSKTDCATAKNYIESIRSKSKAEKPSIECKTVKQPKPDIDDSNYIPDIRSRYPEPNNQELQDSSTGMLIMNKYPPRPYISTRQDEMVAWNFHQRQQTANKIHDLAISPCQPADGSGLAVLEGETIVDDQSEKGICSTEFDRALHTLNVETEMIGFFLLVIFVIFIFVIDHPIYGAICILSLILLKPGAVRHGLGQQ
jgi:hypothetical protein